MTGPVLAILVSSWSLSKAFISPNSMTQYLKWQQRHQNVVFDLLPCLICNELYVAIRSNLVYHFALARRLSRVQINKKNSCSSWLLHSIFGNLCIVANLCHSFLWKTPGPWQGFAKNNKPFFKHLIDVFTKNFKFWFTIITRWTKRWDFVLFYLNCLVMLATFSQDVSAMLIKNVRKICILRWKSNRVYLLLIWNAFQNSTNQQLNISLYAESYQIFLHDQIGFYTFWVTNFRQFL